MPLVCILTQTPEREQYARYGRRAGNDARAMPFAMDVSADVHRLGHRGIAPNVATGAHFPFPRRTNNRSGQTVTPARTR